MATTGESVRFYVMSCSASGQKVTDKDAGIIAEGLKLNSTLKKLAVNGL